MLCLSQNEIMSKNNLLNISINPNALSSIGKKLINSISSIPMRMNKPPPKKIVFLKLIKYSRSIQWIREKCRFDSYSQKFALLPILGNRRAELRWITLLRWVTLPARLCGAPRARWERWCIYRTLRAAPGAWVRLCMIPRSVRCRFATENLRCRTTTTSNEPCSFLSK